MGAGRQYTTEEIVKVLTAANGLVSVAARSLGCSPSTIRRRMEAEPEIQQAVDEARESLVDLAEKKLRTAINKGQPWAVSLTLRTLGKNRGYVERVEQTGANGGPIQTEELNGAGERILGRIDRIADRIGANSGTGSASADASG